MYLTGNVIADFPEASKENWKGIRYGKNLTPQAEAAIRVEKPFSTSRPELQTAEAAYRTVLAEAGATLPARDPVDLRIVDDVRNGTGRIIDKETDLPPDRRWPTYHSLPVPKDTDGDGIPDFWEEQFGLDPRNPKDSRAIGHGGYAHIEHYFNNTDPKGGATPIVFVSGAVSRARIGTNGALRITRSGGTKEPLTIRYAVEGDAVAKQDFEALSGRVTIPAGKSSALIPVTPLPAMADGARLVVVRLIVGEKAYNVGCPSAALVEIKK
jgi:hypothetical protein